jgi:hypothetical protein
MRPGTTVETSDDVPDAQLVERLRGQAFATVARTPRRGSREPRCFCPDADLMRMTPMPSAARCSCSSLVAARAIKTVERAQTLRPAQRPRSSQTPRHRTKASTRPDEK